MTIAVFSDIHGNLEALEAALRDAEAHGADAFACLGDVVGYGANPNECCERVRALGATVVRGNHDHACSHRTSLAWFNPVAAAAMRWGRKRLSSENREWLRALPYTAALPDGTQLVHGALNGPSRWPYVFEGAEAAGHFPRQRAPLCFNGHTHVPAIFLQAGKRLFQAPPEPFAADPAAGAKLLVNVGSVGQPRDDDPRAAYVLYDPATRRIEFRRVAYDVRRAAKKILAEGLPPLLGLRLFKGR